MTIELAIALTSPDTYLPRNYIYAPGMTSQVLDMRAELQRTLDADARTVVAHLSKEGSDGNIAL